ncbi:MAG TPA: TlpA disulfide reductase family protein [Baekduia sp.]|uniref:TlpA disulfide reductase family protein n=1 Tax=Baekduia sp. TaxID=2600305 RepID=UPI002C99C0F2|nr:TlpA disulfide reductase family protein [Baekduia sp.]HMJ36800.1 TlpA disulfide reductase family protein [Baekduia sp.]
MSGGSEPGPLDFDAGPGDDGAPAPRRAPGAPRAPRRRPPAPPGGARYLWVVGAAALVLVLVLVVATVQHGTERGARGIPAGDAIPPFAVPRALSALDGDANLARRAGEGAAGNRPACSVRRPDVLNGCVLRDRGPLVLAFFATRGKECVDQLDVMERVRAQTPGVQFAAIAIRGDRDAVRSLIRRHGWRFDVGYDRDGALANAFHVQVCPQLTFARQGGRVVETTFGELRGPALAAKARRLATR